MLGAIVPVALTQSPGQTVVLCGSQADSIGTHRNLQMVRNDICSRLVMHHKRMPEGDSIDDLWSLLDGYDSMIMLYTVSIVMLTPLIMVLSVLHASIRRRNRRRCHIFVLKPVHYRPSPQLQQIFSWPS